MSLILLPTNVRWQTVSHVEADVTMLCIAHMPKLLLHNSMTSLAKHILVIGECDCDRLTMGC